MRGTNDLQPRRGGTLLPLEANPVISLVASQLNKSQQSKLGEKEMAVHSKHREISHVKGAFTWAYKGPVFSAGTERFTTYGPKLELKTGPF